MTVEDEGEKPSAPESFRSWSLRKLLASSRERVEVSETSSEEITTRGRKIRRTGGGSHSPSPVSPIAGSFITPVKAILAPSQTFSRLKEEREQLSRQTPSPKESTLRDGITLPLVGEIKWETVTHLVKDWLRNPKNLALLLWGFAVGVSGAILFMVMVGMLNGVLPKKADRDLWFEISNQILNALFTLMVLYLHPTRILHLVWLIRWRPEDIVKLRNVYCKGGMRKPQEWAHMLVVVFLLHLNCFSQYALCGLNWGYRRANRPAIGVGICLASAIGAAAAAGIYNTLSPLGRDFVAEDGEGEHDESIDQLEKGHCRNPPSLFHLSRTYRLLERRLSFASREGKLVEDPQWQGGLFGCCEDATISCVSTGCFVCVLGWNLDRLGFGNRFVHIITFLLLCSAPYFVFDLAAINVNNKYVRHSLGYAGIVLSVFGLLYGGFWRIRMRERYKLPAQKWCCGQPNMTDCTQWLFCGICSLCQEVRTAEAFDIRDDKFYVRTKGVNTPGQSSPERNLGDDVTHVPASTIQPLPISAMLPIKESELVAMKETVLVPPAPQILNHVEEEDLSTG